MAEETKKNKWIQALATMMMGVGGGMSGQDYLGNFMRMQQIQQEQQQLQKKQQAQQAQQAFQNQMNLQKAGYSPATAPQQAYQNFLAQSRGGWGQQYMQPMIQTPEGETFIKSLKNLPDTERKFRLQIRKTAQTEASRQMGGSMMMGMVGMDEKKRKKYTDLVEKLYKQYLKEYGKGGMGAGVGTEEELIDYMDTNW